MFVLLGGVMGMDKIVGYAKRFEKMIQEAENMSLDAEVCKSVDDLLEYFQTDIPNSILGHLKRV